MTVMGDLSIYKVVLPIIVYTTVQAAQHGQSRCWLIGVSSLSKIDWLHNSPSIKLLPNNCQREYRSATFANDLNQPTQIGATVIRHLGSWMNTCPQIQASLENHVSYSDSIKTPTEPTIKVRTNIPKVILEPFYLKPY